MKKIRIIFGFLLLYWAGKEYGAITKEFSSFLNIGIVPVFVFLLGAVWLIGSGFSKGGFQLFSVKAIKYWIISMVTLLAIAFVSLLSSSIFPTDIVEINGEKIPLGKCIEGNRRLIKDKNEAFQYCKCIAEKILSDSILGPKHIDDLKNNHPEVAFSELKNKDIIERLKPGECLENVEAQWTPLVVEGMKKNFKSQLVDTEFETTNDIDRYCDCLLSEFQKFPTDTIKKEGFYSSSLFYEINAKCDSVSSKE
ncbi:hypothetical protein [Wenyingzhuangia sp. IMCC45574]